MTTPEQHPDPKAYRYVGRRGFRRPIIKGQDGTQWRDAYHGVLTVSWTTFFVLLAFYFVAVNTFFALLYAIAPHAIRNAASFWELMLFSVQTMTSGSYTDFTPASPYAYVVMCCEAFLGIVNLALVTGIVFARFSRPFARVVFSKVAVIAPFEGVPTLMFRAANQRANLIFDAAVTVSFAREVVTKEGHAMRRFEELSLLRSRTPLFSLSWTVMHRIDETSPLYGLGPDALYDMEAEIIVMLSGTDETLADVIYARHSYTPDELLPERKFVDVISTTDSGRRMVDLNRFHDTEPFVAYVAEDVELAEEAETKT